MKKLLIPLFLALGFGLGALAQNTGTGPVVKKTSGADKNDIVEDVNIGSGRTVTVKSGGTLNASAGTLTLADGQIAQAKINGLTTDLAATVPATRTVAGKALSSDVTLVKGDVGLGNVDNTSDATKNASAATLTNKTIDASNVIADGALAQLDFQIVNHDKLRAALAASAVRRVAIFGFSDSNHLFGGHGFAMHLPIALGRAYGCYGSGVLIGSGIWSGLNKSNNLTGAMVSTGAPSQLTTLWPSSYAYLPEGQSTGVLSYQQAALGVGLPLDTRASLLFRIRYGTFPFGSNSWTPTIRRDESPFTGIATGTTFTPNTGSYGLVDYTYTLTGGPTRLKWPLVLTPGAVNSTLNGPFFQAWASVENADMTTGVSYTPVWAAPGQSFRKWLSDMQAPGVSVYFDELFRGVRLGLTGTIKSGVAWINGGLNDQNETLPSLGPSPVSDGSSAAAVVDNLTGIVNLVTARWIAQGGSASDLHFCFVISHPQARPDTAKLIAYRAAVARLARSLPNASAISIPAIRDYDDFVAGGWYDGGGNPHLTSAGYAAISNALVRAIRTRDDLLSFSVSATLDFPSIAAGASADLQILVPGAAAGQTVQIGLPQSPTAGVIYTAWVSAADVVTVRATNVTASSIDPASATHRITVGSQTAAVTRHHQLGDFEEIPLAV